MACSVMGQGERGPGRWTQVRLRSHSPISRRFSMLSQLRNRFGTGHDRGFTLIELLITILIVGILAAVAAPIYLGYVKDAKTAEGKAVAGSLWTAVQSNAIGACGNASAVVDGYAKAGLTTTGTTIPARWAVGASP